MTIDATLGGYLDTHERPPAFEGVDGQAYSVQMYVDEKPCDDGRFGAAILFVRWSAAGDRPTGHLETEFLAHGDSPAAASSSLRSLTLHQLKARLDKLIALQKELSDW